MQQAVRNAQDNGSPVKLHLGCGPVLLDGWINVDGSYCEGQSGVIIHNLTEPYPLDSNAVDEILSVHVIEHISNELVLPLFKEWLRILKPGGCVAIEWPDLLKMCQFIADHPESLYSDNKKIQKRSVAGIFGNTAKYPDIAMIHKWGYSAESMQLLLLTAGFSAAVVEKPLYGKTEMDSRVVACK